MNFRERPVTTARGAAYALAPLGPRFIAVAGGKGGVGKTNVAANLAVAFSSAGKRVLLFDGDLGLANIDVVLGLTPRYTVRHVLERRRSLADIVLEGPGGVDVIPAGSGVVELAQLPREVCSRLALELARVAARYDIVVVDTPAGIAGNVLRFTGLADEILLVTTPEPTAVVDAYALAKIIHAASPYKPVRLLINMASDPEEGRHVAVAFADIVRRFLHKEIPCVGRLPYDPNVPLAVRRQKPYVLCFPDCTASRLLRTLAAELLTEDPDPSGGQNLHNRLARLFDRTAEPSGAGTGR